MAADRILLVVLDDGGMRRRLVVEDDIEDGVKAVRPAERAPQRPLGNDERVRLMATAVEDSGDQAFSAQTA
jgi:hypothetical protein